jgi:5-methylcytosine-specific restriction endonuclease McrA
MQVYKLDLNIDQVCRAARRATINPRPEYQRTHEGVWTLGKKQLLMDSILRGYDIPKIYFRLVDDGAYKHEVVDGQQRLRAIWEFFDGKWPLGSISADLPFGDQAEKYYSDLDTELQDEFGAFGLSIHEIQGASDAEIRDLFLRLQEGTSLNPAEKRNAMMGQMRDFIADLAGEPHPVFPLTRIAGSRNAWDDLAAHVVRLQLEGGPADIKAENLKRMYETNPSFDPASAVAKKVKRTLNQMARVLKSAPPEMDIKWGFVDLYLALSVLDEGYALSGRDLDIASSFIAFETERRQAVASGDVSELLSAGHDDWDRDLYNYIQAFQREGNKRSNVEVRHHVYVRRLLRDVQPPSKDPKRAFTSTERLILWRLAGGQCQLCGAAVTFENCHADHIVAHSSGGVTELSNGQCLCASCNLKKGNKSKP